MRRKRAKWLPPPTPQHPIAQFVIKLGAVSAAILATGTLFIVIGSFTWRKVTAQVVAPVILLIAEERVARTNADSAFAREIRGMREDVRVVGQALQYPVGSARQEAVLEKIDEPRSQKPQRGARTRR